MDELPFLPFGRPMIGDAERRAALETLDGPILVHGPRAKAFEDAFAAWTGAPCAVSVSSCTAGLHLIHFALGYGPGDEVIVPAQTHIATAHAVALTGATPVFVDADPATGNIAIDAIEAAITPRTRAVTVVHFLGLPVDMIRVVDIARRHGLFVLEDCALAFGARQQGAHAGTLGDAGVFSFYPVKHMTTAEGGMIVTRDPKLAERLTRLRAFGVDRSHGERATPGDYDVTALGFNYRMNELEAAIGIEQLKRLDGFLAARTANFKILADRLAGLDGVSVLPADTADGVGGRYCLQAVLDAPLAARRREIMERLKTLGIGVSIYYPRPAPLMSWYRDRGGHRPEHFPGARHISDRSISLSVGPHLSPADMERIASAFRLAVEENAP